MNYKKFILAAVASGLVILIVMTLFGFITQIIAPYDIASVGGMRAFNDPLLMLFFLSPFIIGFVTTYFYIATKKSFTGNEKENAIKLGLLMYLVYTIPSEFIIITSMTYPLGFHLDNLIGGFIYLILASFIIVKILK
ncbi:MAG: hypothetical protein WCW13_05735 [archaeon]|jgi:hypothetical protein